MSTFQQRIQTKTKGFTIVELLIVIVVIAILAAIGIVAYTGVQGRARDSATDAVVQQLQRGLNLYYVDHGSYPSACGSGSSDPCGASNLESALVPEYLGSLPNFDDGDVRYVARPNGAAYGMRINYEGRDSCRILVGNNPILTWWSSHPDC